MKNTLLLSGFQTSFSSKNRVGQETFLEDLFGTESACIGETNDWKEKVCYKFNDPLEKIGVINPWLHGFYNPYERCDVSYGTQQKANDEYIDTIIYPIDNMQYPPDMPWGSECLNKRGDVVTSPGNITAQITKAKIFFAFVIFLFCVRPVAIQHKPSHSYRQPSI